MRSIKGKKEVIDQALIKHGPHTYTWTPEIGALMDVACNAVDWAERARANIYEFQSRLGNYEYCDEDDSCPCVFCVAAKLLKELPEE